MIYEQLSHILYFNMSIYIGVYNTFVFNEKQCANMHNADKDPWQSLPHHFYTGV